MLRLAALLILCALPLRAETALVAVAANFASAAQALAGLYAGETGHEILLTTGATGKLYAQITQGAPFDLMLSADAATPAKLHAAGHGVPQPYAIGILTLWMPSMSPGQDPAIALQDSTIRHIAIANPDLAPYGTASVAALEAMGIYAAIAGKIVMGQNIGQAFALVHSGAAEAGFVARSALPEAAKGYVWNVTPAFYPPIRQDAILLKHGAGNVAAAGFLAFLATPAARDTIARHGYALP